MQNCACKREGEKNVDTMPISAPRQAGIYVRRSREAQGLTRAQLAAMSGVSERLLASLELGDATGIRLDKLLAVFEALGLSLVAQGEKIASPAAVSADAPTAASPQVCKEPRMMPKPGIRQNTEPAGISSLLSAYSEVLREIAREQGIHLAGEAI